MTSQNFFSTFIMLEGESGSINSISTNVLSRLNCFMNQSFAVLTWAENSPARAGSDANAVLRDGREAVEWLSGGGGVHCIVGLLMLELSLGFWLLLFKVERV